MERPGWRMVHFEVGGMPLLFAAEDEWTTLWWSYFSGIAISERPNRKLQQQFLP